MASLESVWGEMLWAAELALAEGLWKGQCAEWVRAVPKLPPFKGCGLVGGGATAQLIPAGAQEANRDERNGNKGQAQGVFDPSHHFFFVLCPT